MTVKTTCPALGEDAGNPHQVELSHSGISQGQLEAGELLLVLTRTLGEKDHSRNRNHLFPP
jgi:hypothetical protein